MKIPIKGVIVSNNDKRVYEWFGMDATSPKDVSSQLDNLQNEDIEVEINSGGGSVYAGSEIYTTLKGYNGKVTTKIIGIAASAASLIAMAGNQVLISPTAQIMIHNVSSVAMGDYRDLQHQSDVMKNYNKSIANAYKLKTGMEEKELLKLMDNETWLNAQQAKEKGFVDEVMFDNTNQLVASISDNQMLPQQVINKILNSINPVNQSDFLMQQKVETQLKLLKMKREVI